MKLLRCLHFCHRRFPKLEEKNGKGITGGVRVEYLRCQLLALPIQVDASARACHNPVSLSLSTGEVSGHGQQQEGSVSQQGEVSGHGQQQEGSVSQQGKLVGMVNNRKAWAWSTTGKAQSLNRGRRLSLSTGEVSMVNNREGSQQGKLVGMVNNRKAQSLNRGRKAQSPQAQGKLSGHGQQQEGSVSQQGKLVGMVNNRKAQGALNKGKISGHGQQQEGQWLSTGEVSGHGQTTGRLRSLNRGS
ncbi:hypothetical protein RRG08_007446 [Elysia crispata]|uniref:Uncharacterized protein n=1 Tax=Elysia crispata TaxID=231223 RepID=A0AAE1DUL2_9GAST|nr:hypothetical protein RRG08_007446 [Elysia crispata]